MSADPDTKKNVRANSLFEGGTYFRFSEMSGDSDTGHPDTRCKLHSFGISREIFQAEVSQAL